MTERPGSTLAARPLHFFIVADCSGSMAADGKMQALNNAIRETLPHLVDVASQNPHAAIARPRRSRSRPAPAGTSQSRRPSIASVWHDLDDRRLHRPRRGPRPAGAAARVAVRWRSGRCRRRSSLISDGMPTDDYKPALGRLLDEPMGQRAVRMAVGIGRDADLDVLARFIGSAM